LPVGLPGVRLAWPEIVTAKWSPTIPGGSMAAETSSRACSAARRVAVFWSLSVQLER
jgi:hypothetical protein